MNENEQQTSDKIQDYVEKKWRQKPKAVIAVGAFLALALLAVLFGSGVVKI